MNELQKLAFVNSSLTTLYIIGVASLIFIAGSLEIGKKFPALMIVTMLMLFVSTAAITGFLVAGKPAMLYIDGKKNDALKLLINTFLILGAYTFLLFVALIIISITL